MECNHCHAKLANKSSLNNHQKTVKYCLQIQNKNKGSKKVNKRYDENDDGKGDERDNKKDNEKDNKRGDEKGNENEERDNKKDNDKGYERDKKKDKKKDNRKDNNDFKCEYCLIILTTSSRYKYHISNCKEKQKKICERQNEEIRRLNNEIKKLNDIIIDIKARNSLLERINDRSSICLEEIAKQPKIQNSKQTLNMLTPLTLTQQEATHVIHDYFDDQYFYDGQKGAAKFAVDNLLKDSDGNLKYICTDPSRQIFKFKTEDGDMKKDIKAKKLTEMLMPGLKYKAMNISKEEFGKYSGNVDMILVISTKQGELRNIQDDNTIFRNELSVLTTEK